jgi:hypothetical protein
MGFKLDTCLSLCILSERMQRHAHDSVEPSAVAPQGQQVDRRRGKYVALYNRQRPGACSGQLQSVLHLSSMDSSY